MLRRSVLITGCSTGIGKACAVHLDKIGFRVFAGVRRDSDADALKIESRDRIEPVYIDVTELESINSAAKYVSDKLSGAGLYGLVNNAGIVIAGPLEFLPLEQIRKQFDVNLFGQIAVTQIFLPMIRKAKGRIVNMGSNSGLIAAPMIGPYSASKFALEAFTDSLRIELKSSGIAVSIIEPGDVNTPIWQKSAAVAQELATHYPDTAISFYSPFFSAVEAVSEKAPQNGIAPDSVAELVAHALTAKKPRTRYLVGKHVWLQSFLKKCLPDRMFDRLILKSLGL